MSLSSPFVRRPVATILLALAIVLLGSLAYERLPVAPLPNVSFPTILVSASLSGANPETMASTVATPLERSLGRIPGITQMTSSSSDSSTSVIIQFDLDKDINVAAQFADDVIAMRDGRVVHHGPVAEVVTAEKLSALYETPARVVEVEGRRVVLWE